MKLDPCSNHKYNRLHVRLNNGASNSEKTNCFWTSFQLLTPQHFILGVLSTKTFQSQNCSCSRLKAYKVELIIFKDSVLSNVI